jgi:transcriptional regulator with XRE-family HTH domain
MRMVQQQLQEQQQQVPTDLLTVTAAAQRSGLPRTIISGWITTGQLPAVRIHGRRHIRVEDLAATQAHAHEGEVVPVWRQNRKRGGKRLRAIREAAGLNQIQLAAASGLTHEAISRLETGRCWPHAETVRKLAGALDVDPERFIARDKTTGLTLLTVAEAASRLEVPAGRVQTWLRKGQVSGTKVSGEWRVPSVVIAELARSGRLRGRSGRLDPRYRG